MHIHATHDRTCVRLYCNLTGLALTHTDSCQAACNQITYRQKMKRLMNTWQYEIRSLPNYRGQRPTRLFRAAHRSQVCHCLRPRSVLNVEDYLVRALREARWLNEAVDVFGICVVYTQPAEQYSPCCTTYQPAAASSIVTTLYIITGSLSLNGYTNTNNSNNNNNENNTYTNVHVTQTSFQVPRKCHWKIF